MGRKVGVDRERVRRRTPLPQRLKPIIFRQGPCRPEGLLHPKAVAALPIFDCFMPMEFFMPVWVELRFVIDELSEAGSPLLPHSSQKKA